MQWMQFFTLYLISFPVFMVIDLLWIGVLAKDFYKSQVGHLMEIDWYGAIAFYLVFLFGLTYFVLYPTASEGWRAAAFLGGMYGFFTYATYNLTNVATLRDWTWTLVAVDLVWGAVFGASIAAVTVAVYTVIS